MKTLLVKFRICEQVSPDDFEMRSKEKMFDTDDKISSIKDWVLSQNGYVRHDNGYKHMIEVFLSEPQ